MVRISNMRDDRSFKTRGNINKIEQKKTNTTVRKTSGNSIQGEIKIKANEHVRAIHVIVSEDVAHTGQLKVSIGTVTGGDQVLTLTPIGPKNKTGTSTLKGLGNSTDAGYSLLLGSPSPLLVKTNGHAFSTSNRIFYFTVQGDAGTSTTGAVDFVVEYL